MPTNKVRQNDLKFHDFKYVNAKTPDNACIYCGEEGEVYDHVPPISIAYQYTGTFLKIPSCRSCNRYLWNIPIFHLSGRKQHIRERLYRVRDLYIPKWTKNDIKEITGRLKAYVKKGLKKQEVLRRRIVYITMTFEEEFQEFIYEDYENVKTKLKT